MSEQSISVNRTADNELTIKIMGHEVRIITESKINSFFVDIPTHGQSRFTGLGELKENEAAQHFVVIDEGGIVR